MKKLSIVVAALVIAGVVSSSAQVSNWINTTSNEVAGFVVGPLPITFKGRLSNKGTVDQAALAALTPGGGTLEFAAGYDVAALHTGQVFMAVGTSFGTSNIVSGTSTGVTLVGYTILAAGDYVNLSKAGSKSVKSLSGWSEDGFGRLNGTTTNFLFTVNKVVSNATLLVAGTISSTAKGKTAPTPADFRVSAKVTGVWFDGVSTISASVGTAKK